MERAREQLREVTLVMATAEAKYSELNSTCQIDCTFPEFMERLQYKKRVLQEEVLSYLGLRWTAPSLLRGWASPPLLASRRSAEFLRPKVHRSWDRVPMNEGRHAWRPPAFCEQDANDGRIPLTPSEDTFGALGDCDDEDPLPRGDSVPAEGRPPGGGLAAASLDDPVESASVPLLSSWRESSTSQRRPATPETRAPIWVSPRRTEEVSVVKRIPSSIQGPGIASVRSRSPVATRQQQQQQQQLPTIAAVAAVAAVAGSPPPIDPSRLFDVSDDAERPDECVLPTALRVTTRTAAEGGNGSRNNRWRSLEPRIVPEDFNSRRLARPSTSLAFADRMSLWNAISTSPHSSESDFGNEGTRGPTRRAGDDRAADAVEAELDLTLRGPTSVLWPQRTEGAYEIDRTPSAHTEVRSTDKARVNGVTSRVDRSSTRPQGVSSRGSHGCRDAGCHRRPIYAFRGDTKALCCPLHRSEDMVNVRHHLCRHESCFRQPSFGMEGDKRARYCSEHKHPGMTNVSSRRCQASDCLRHPNFGFQGDRRASYCCRHKSPGMVDVVSRRCKSPRCMRRPLYAITGQHAVFCRVHKEPGMTDVVSRRCDFEGGCDRHPSFGWKRGDGRARRCARHRLEGMESVKVNRRASANAK